MGNRFLAGIREVDALLLVLRSFADDEVPGESDPLGALETLELELVMADAASLENQADKRRKQARLKADRQLGAEADAIDAAMAASAGRASPSTGPACRRPSASSWRVRSSSPTSRCWRSSTWARTRWSSPTRSSPRWRRASAGAGQVLGVCVQLEAEAAQLPADQRDELLEGLGLGQGVLPRLARVAFELLGLRTFLTTGDKESRAWIFRAGAKAPECAGVIHSDLQRGFIRAEVIHWDELIELGGWPKAKAAGRLRVEGKDYEVLDGDVLEIRFNV